MIIHPAKQGTPEWLLARAGIPTASEWDSLLTPKFEPRKGEMPKTYLAKKLAEKWIGGPLPDHGTWAMDQGQLLENEAIPFFELETGHQVSRVGLCLSDDQKVGCSPDGLIGELSGLEIKCPRPETHVRYLLAGTLPTDYIVQVHGGMFVTGREQWTFVSYARGFPPFVWIEQRDARIQAVIEEVLGGFCADLATAMEKLTEINGEAPRPKAKETYEQKFEREFA